MTDTARQLPFIQDVAAWECANCGKFSTADKPPFVVELAVVDGTIDGVDKDYSATLATRMVLEHRVCCNNCTWALTGGKYGNAK